MTAATIAERVAVGGAFLDEHDPDWWRADVERAIDLDELDLGDPNGCILGQRCPLESLERYVFARFGEPLSEVTEPEDWNFWARACELSGLPTGTEGEPASELVAWSARLGFNSQTGSGDEYNALTAEWERVITERRSAS